MRAAAGEHRSAPDARPVQGGHPAAHDRKRRPARHRHRRAPAHPEQDRAAIAVLTFGQARRSAREPQRGRVVVAVWH